MPLPPPDAFDLPEHYVSWRQSQPEAILSILGCETRFLGQVCPTGFGKSLVYIVAALLMDGRTLILTSTKGLQDQLARDFGDRLADVRGRNSYRCQLDHALRCDQGPCIAGAKCGLKDGGCSYYDAVRAARAASIVSTNYAYWMTTRRYAEGLGEFKFLVMDEAHDSPETVASFMTISLSRKDPLLRHLMPPGDLGQHSVADWAAWAKAQTPAVKDEVRVYAGKIRAQGGSKDLLRHFASLRSLQAKLEDLARADDDWVVDCRKGDVEVSPLWPRKFAEARLFASIPRVLLTSATVRPKTASLLGIYEDLTWEEHPHSFPLANRRLIWIPTVRLNWRSSDRDLIWWLRRIDQIVGQRLDRKGIVHTVSYKRRNLVVEHSRYARMMRTHQRRDTAWVVHRFKEEPGPAVLVSPVMTTGWDFPYSECEYQILGKIPYPDTTSKIVKARTAEDDGYAAYIAMQQLVQTCGRGVRAQDDRCESFIIDDNVSWFLPRYSDFAPEWFRGAFGRSDRVPEPTPKLVIK